jgi:hypothetical protein
MRERPIATRSNIDQQCVAATAQKLDIFRIHYSFVETERPCRNAGDSDLPPRFRSKTSCISNPSPGYRTARQEAIFSACGEPTIVIIWIMLITIMLIWIMLKANP